MPRIPEELIWFGNRSIKALAEVYPDGLDLPIMVYWLKRRCAGRHAYRVVSSAQRPTYYQHKWPMADVGDLQPLRASNYVL
jgi:hypothetical protein